MSQQLKLVISDSKKVLETISKVTVDTHPAAMVKAVDDFRQLVNTALTKLIVDHDNTGDFMNEEEGNSDVDEQEIQVSPKKRRK